MNESEEEELLFFETFSHDNSEVSIYFVQWAYRNTNGLQRKTTKTQRASTDAGVHLSVRIHLNIRAVTEWQ